MNRVAIRVGAAVFLVSSVPALAGDDPKKLLDEGEKVLKALAAAAPLPSDTLYFETVMDGESVGYAVQTLTLAGRRPNSGYSYEFETSLKTKDGLRIDGLATVTLDADFRPQRIKVTRKLVMPGGAGDLSSTEEAVIDQGEIKLTRDDGQNKDTRSVPCPKESFAFAIERLVLHVDFDKHRSFALRELNPQTGELIVQTFSVERQKDGNTKVSTTAEGGGSAYEFLFGKEGELIEYGEPPLTVRLKASTSDAVDQIKARIR